MDIPASRPDETIGPFIRSGLWVNMLKLSQVLCSIAKWT